MSSGMRHSISPVESACFVSPLIYMGARAEISERATRCG